MSVSVIVVDDHQLFAHSLACLLESMDDIEVCGVAPDGGSAARLVDRFMPDVVLMGPCAASGSAPETTSRLRERWPDIAVLAVSTCGDAWHARRLAEAGARGFLTPDCRPDEAADAIRALAKGGTAFNGAHRSRVNDDSTRHPRSMLTRREIEIVGLICDCFRTSEIAERLSISAKTVDCHRKNIMDKLEIRTVAGLTRYALRHGLANSAHER